MFKEIIGLCVKLYQPLKFGTLVCVPVMERSSSAKARCLAMNECKTCIELAGPSAISKRGLQHICKTLAEEALLENRVAALDLAEEIIRKLNGDTNRFYIACGNSLSIKTKSMIEERWLKNNSLNAESNGGESKAQHRQEHLRQGASTPAKVQTIKNNEASRETAETPSSKLHKETVNSSGAALQTSKEASSFKIEEGPFTFKYTSSFSQNYNSVETSFPALDVTLKNHVDVKSTVALPLLLKEIAPDSENQVGNENVEGKADAKISASAASLRARLKKIRDRTSLDPNQPPPPIDRSQKALVADQMSSKFTIRSSYQEILSYSDLRDKIDVMLQLRSPISSTCNEVVEVTSMMEKLVLFIESCSDAVMDDLKSDVSAFVSRLIRQVCKKYCGTFLHVSSKISLSSLL